MLGRRKFLKFLGLGAASTTVAKNITIIENKEDLRNDPKSIMENISESTPASFVAHNTGGSGGLVLNDVVNIDLTRQQYNAHQDEMQLGISGCLGRHYSQNYINIGDIIYANEKGDIINNKTDQAIGVSISSQDEDGFFTIQYN